jgi:hypothetical protein
MLTSYKFWYILRNDNGFITEAAVRFYEGEFTTLPEKKAQLGGGFIDENVTRFRYKDRLTKDQIAYLGVATKKELSGKDCAIFTLAHFGKIKTDIELTKFLNKQIAKDTERTPVDKQK